MIIHYIGVRMKISEKLEQLKNDKSETAKQLKEDIKDLKITSMNDMKEQKALLDIWADINNQIEEMELMIERLARLSR